MSDRLSRRRFLQSSAAAAAFAAAGSAFAAPNNRRNGPRLKPHAMPTTFKDLNVAAICCGGRGASDLYEIANLGVNIVALCDVDVNQLFKPSNDFPNANTYVDFREMLDQEKHIDAVTVGTPDHTHAQAALLAIRKGKHVYCEKPLTHNIYEARLMLDAARQYKVATQMGNQGHSSEGSRVQVECIRAGVIGTVKEVHICTDRPIWPQGIPLPTEKPMIPETLSWDLWLGPAQRRPYNPAYAPFKWRGFWDYGTGALGDMGCHLMDAPYWALDLRDPVSVEAKSDGATEYTAPHWSIITYEFPERNGRAPVKVVWYDGGKLPPDELTPDFKRPDKNNYIIYVGTSGTMFAKLNSSPELVGDKDKKFQPPTPSIPRVKGGHHQNFLEACMGGEPADSNFEYSVPLTEMVILGNLAIRTNKKVTWDSANMRASSPEEANQFVSREYRRGWEL